MVPCPCQGFGVDHMWSLYPSFEAKHRWGNYGRGQLVRAPGKDGGQK